MLCIEERIRMLDRAVWAEIDLAAIAHNLQVIKEHIAGNARLCAVVKADAYGHGAVPVARKAVEAGASYLAVAVLSEALELRRAGFTVPILILGAAMPEAAGVLVDYDITQAVYALDMAEAISAEAVRRGKTAKLHLAVDTGMGRIGVRPREAGSLARAIAALPGIELEGMFSHFALSDSHDKTYAKLQAERFQAAAKAVKDAGVSIAIHHLANSAAILDMPEVHFDMVRAGIILYGLCPSAESGQQADIWPAMKVITRLGLVKDMQPGEKISYGCTYTVARPSRIATLPFGYADGYTRLFAGKASIELQGHRAPIVGRICMDQCMADVTDIPGAAEGAEAVVFGSPSLPVDEAADWLGTINYEIVCMVNKRVPRVYKDKE